MEKAVWLISYQTTAHLLYTVAPQSQCQTQPQDPILTPPARPVVSVMSATPSHPPTPGRVPSGALWEGLRRVL